jgi:NAD(P)-dependent dehydrogenase (short-subunit alcohol dehydrogenase family)
MKERVLITGCSRGIGLALAEEFARADWEVFATSRAPQRPELAALARKWTNVTTLALDVCGPLPVAGASLSYPKYGPRMTGM